MRKELIIFLQLCMFVYSVEDTLRMVQVVVRHCERTPVMSEMYLTSPYHHESTFEPYGYGQLTNEGKKNCYKVGQALRQRYEGFISPAYHYSIVDGISSSVGRAKETLQLVLAGLFPPTEELKWSTELNWQPIATYYEKQETDMAMAFIGTPLYDTEFDKFEETEESEKFRAPFEEFKDYMSQHTGEKLDYRKVVEYSLGLEHLDTSGYKLADWTKSIYPNTTEEFLQEYFLSCFATKKLRRIASGFLLRKIFEDAEMKINGSFHKQIIIYSGHDITLVALLKGLDVWDKVIPPVSTYCILELHLINNTYGFKIYYFNGTEDAPYSFILPGYGRFVPFEKLKIEKHEYLHLEDLEGHSTSARNKINYLVLTIFVILALCSQI